MTFLRITLLCWRPSPSLKESVLKAHCSVPVLTFLFTVLGCFSKPRANLQLQGPWPNVCFTLERTPGPCGGFRRKSVAPRLHLLLLRSVSSDPLSHFPSPCESFYAVSSLVFCLEINQVNRKFWRCLRVMPRGASPQHGLVYCNFSHLKQTKLGGGLSILSHNYLHVQEKGALTETAKTRSNVFSRAEYYMCEITAIPPPA